MNELFTEKYRPVNLKQIALPARIKSFLEKGVQTNLLFYGSQGTGKTSTAKLLVKQFQHNYIYINCSKETGIDTIREKITNFCSSASFLHSQNTKVVIMDEMDGMSLQAYQALRGCIEEFACNTRFIATCNFISKVPEPIQSRFECISFDFDTDETKEVKIQFIDTIRSICEEELMSIDNAAINILLKTNYPDMRSIVNKLQVLKTQGLSHIKKEDVSKYNSSFTNVFDLVINGCDPVENYRVLVSEYAGKTDEVLNSLGREFTEYIINNHPTLTSFIPHLTITAAKYQNQKFNSIDTVVCMLACVYEMQLIIQKKV